MVYGSGLIKNTTLRLNLSCSDSENDLKYTFKNAPTLGTIRKVLANKGSKTG